MERIAAIIALLLLAPLLILLAIVLVLMSGRSPLVAHLRVGKDGAPLWVLKYRTMWQRRISGFVPRCIERISESAATMKCAGDPRVTSRFARFLRRHSIDELPQLIHIARGEMSLVGPRPITAQELHDHYGIYAEEVITVLPGLTGLWQIMGRNRLTYRQRLRFDLFLVRHSCIRLYVRVLWATIPQVLRGRDTY